MQGLKGEYRHKLDAKGRVSLPAVLRKVLPGDLVITISPENTYLMIFTPEDYEEWVASLFGEEGYTATNPEHRNMRRFINSRTKDVEVDSAGRIGIAPEYRETVGLTKEAVLVGDSDHLEVWDAKRLDETNAQIDAAAWFNKA